MQQVLRQLMGKWFFPSRKSSVFAINTVRPCVRKSGISSGFSIHWFKHLDIALYIPLNLLNHKFCTLTIPVTDQLFHFLTFWCNFFSVIMNFCTFITFCPIFFVTVFIRLRCEVLVGLSQILAQNLSAFLILGTGFLATLFIVSSIVRSFVFMKYSDITYPCAFDLYAFHLCFITSLSIKWLVLCTC